MAQADAVDRDIRPLQSGAGEVGVERIGGRRGEGIDDFRLFRVLFPNIDGRRIGQAGGQTGQGLLRPVHPVEEAFLPAGEGAGHPVLTQEGIVPAHIGAENIVGGGEADGQSGGVAEDGDGAHGVQPGIHGIRLAAGQPVFHA